MKKFVIGLILCGIIIAGYFIFKDDTKDEKALTKVKVGEVTHSIFYTPQYVAHALGYFEDEGLDVEIMLTAGADKVTSAVLSGDVQIGFCGSEATIYVYQQGEKDYLVNFGALTKRDGSFLVAREDIKNFTVEDLKDKKILGGRQGGMPALTLEWALNSNGISSSATDIDTSVEFSSMSGSFIGGNGDFVTLFEPTASELEKEGYGHIVASVGELGGVVPYTAYNAKKSYIEENPDVIKGFNKAIQKGLDYVFDHSDSEVASVIIEFRQKK
ncbi:MAG: ABC transporter substrate-binding protein [Bacilli bacterium]|nr:ABC transporter substrate-binding protein [Bacilli bacterium]